MVGISEGVYMGLEKARNEYYGKDVVDKLAALFHMLYTAFARLVMNPKKKMVNCFHYINRKAREYLEQEMKDNDEKPMGGGFGGDVPDELCYQWAREYFRDADAKEDAELEEKFISKTYTGKAPKAGKKEKPKKAAPKPAPKPADEEQLTFGDFSTEEAAG